ncbi:MAG: DNA/RNA nuclease SfsA [Lentisphaeria bacterium]|nr:DNA/RNA nuclease SfsA [Lentisphaeria bacterium]
MRNRSIFTPNDVTHPAFGETLRYAAGQGVKIIAMDCQETPDSLSIGAPVEVKL